MLSSAIRIGKTGVHEDISVFSPFFLKVTVTVDSSPKV